VRVLAIETATPFAGCAVVDETGVLAESTVRAPMRHLEWLVPAIDGILDGLGLGPEAVEAVAVSRGPGGFTGLRIGIATACAWARTRGVPLLGVGTLEALASVAGPCGLLLPVLDLYRGEVAGALYRAAADGPPECLMEPLVALPGVVAEEAAAVVRATRSPAAAPDPVVVIGDGLIRHGPALLAALGPRAQAGGPHLHPRAAAVGLLAHPRLASGEHDDPLALLPSYGRRPEARPWQETPGRAGNGA